MIKSFIKLTAFLAKELHHIRRQPGLILSLILGPVVILLVFGLGYRTTPPQHKVMVVWPEGIQENGKGVEFLKSNIENNFNVVAYFSTEEQAKQQFLQDRTSAEALMIVPESLASDIQSGNQVKIKILLNEIDVEQEGYITHIFNRFFDEVNKALLENSIEEIQTESGQTQNEVEQVSSDLQQLNSALDNKEVDNARESISSLQNSLELLSASGALDAYSSVNGDSQSNEIEGVLNDLEDLDRLLASGEIEQNQEKIDQTQTRLDSLQSRLGEIKRVPSSTIIAPIINTIENEFREPYDLRVIFSPRVLALVLQHIAISLGALTLVSETSRGTLEYFGVSPASGNQTLLGKYIAYFITLAIIATLLLLSLIYLLGIPHIGSITNLILFMALYIFASLGIGFLISVISRTENQAIQASMLVLLIAIFFSGFILPLKNFKGFVGQVGLVLPITQANVALTDMLLVGNSPELKVWLVVAIIGAVSFLLTLFLWSRKYRNLK